MKTKLIGLKELRENTEKYISEISKGKSFIVLRKSKPLFTISPPDEDESMWEPVIDFTKINKNGVSANIILKRLKTLS